MPPLILTMSITTSARTYIWPLPRAATAKARGLRAYGPPSPRLSAIAETVRRRRGRRHPPRPLRRRQRPLRRRDGPPSPRRAALAGMRPPRHGHGAIAWPRRHRIPTASAQARTGAQVRRPLRGCLRAPAPATLPQHLGATATMPPRSTTGCAAARARSCA